MKSFITSLPFILIIAIAVGFTSCGSTENAEGGENTNDTTNVANEDTTSLTANTETDMALPVDPMGVINPNLATEEELTATGLSAEMVSTILENRPYLTMNDLDALFAPTMDETQREALYSKLFVPFNLNTTAEADFKMIPGVGDRMAHEFEEYRPYVKMEQFRREIGKYVDEAEVARYEQYVFVPVELNTASKEDILLLPGVGERMAHEFEEYRPYTNMGQFSKEIGKYVDDKELARLERFVYLAE